MFLEIRVIIGSTEKMGAGTNFQKHLVALHHVDCCWKPRDIEQREGRILRNGNLNEEVEIFTYVVKDSYDGNMWEKVTNKQRMIDSVMRGDPLVNKVVDSEDSMSFGELQAAALGNPLMKERTEVANKLAGLEINFRSLEIYFKATEINFRATEKVLSRASADFCPHSEEVYATPR